jgi:hypothetical protein
MFQLVLSPVEGDWLITKGVYSWANRAICLAKEADPGQEMREKKNRGAKKKYASKKKEKKVEIRKHLCDSCTVPSNMFSLHFTWK